MPERKGHRGVSNKILLDLVNRHAAARGSRDHLHETLDFIRDETKVVRRGVEHDVEVVTEEIAGEGGVAQAPEWDWLCRGDEFDETADRGEHAPRGKSMKAFLLDAVPHNTAVACGAADSTDSDSDKLRRPSGTRRVVVDARARGIFRPSSSGQLSAMLSALWRPAPPSRHHPSAIASGHPCREKANAEASMP